ncbi:MAG: NAD(P)-dependent oxidoreductase [Candidatus Thermoplasmatota archaeon]|jgi:UDP-glucose 4-epimerase|nr:NAD(P)-dependent oxidoreductase [Candidatus Thermoplasmatota archaeon]MDP7265972.1 NAD(P)-dependent oxidoreductase [Candidatus Thermoplasmatota archaeon]
MKLLITGSSGYIGSILSNFFQKKGIAIVGVDIDNGRSPVTKNYKFYKCNILNEKKLKYIFKKEKPTHVIHLAYILNPLHDIKKEDEIDLKGSRNVLRISNKTSSVKKFIQFSSVSAYGARKNNPLWIPEDQILAPGSYRYALNKKKIENDCNNFTRRNDLKIIILRVCIVFRPSCSKKKGAVTKILKSPFLIKKIKTTKFQLIHENDFNALMDLIVKDETIEGTFNMSPDTFTSVVELFPKKYYLPIPIFLIKMVIDALWSLRIVNINSSGLEFCINDIIVDPSKLIDRYEYKFQYTTLEGFKDSVSQWSDSH